MHNTIMLKVRREVSEKLLAIVVFALIAVAFITKLDFHYVFTDEILYLQTGVEHLNGIYTDVLQVSPLPKYLAGMLYLIFGQNAYFLRLPYALMGVATSFVIYLILKREYGKGFGLLGAILFTTSKIIFNSTRMAMLEPPMHLFWILFHYFFYKTLSTESKKTYYIAGIFLGLSLSIKITSIVLLPFVLLWFLYSLKKQSDNRGAIVKNYLAMILSSALTVFLGYLHLFLKLGLINGVLETIKAVKNVYISKSEAGKVHVIRGKLYEHSPWWTYLYYQVTENGLIRSVFYAATAPFSFLLKNLFVAYWGLFFLLVLMFQQFSGVKNIRYISSFEIPLIMLTVSGAYYLFEKAKNKKLVVLLLTIVVTIFVSNQILYLHNLKPTEYLGLYKYFKKETKNFTEYKRMYVFGSIRSMKWYRDQVPDKNTFLYRKDYEIMCPEFGSFDYFAFDEEELLKDSENFLYRYVMANEGSFERVQELEDMMAYKKLGDFVSLVECPENIVE